MPDDLISRKSALELLGEPHPLDHNAIADVQKIIALPAVDAVPLDKLCECLVRKRIGFVDEVDGKRMTGELTKGAWAALITEWMEELDDGKEPV